MAAGRARPCHRAQLAGEPPRRESFRLAAGGVVDHAIEVAAGAGEGDRGTRLTDLAEQALVTKQTAGFLVNQLERGGYVRRGA
jgi:hypothetical protein